jgi:HEAT repeat protein
MDLSGSLRSNAIKNMGNIGTRDALLALLELAANEKLNAGERKLALKQAERIIK